MSAPVDPGLADWRLLLSRLHASFRAPSMGEAADWVTRVVEFPDVDVDLRAPGVVHLSVPLSEQAVASAISALAAEAGFMPEARSTAVTEVAIDALDIQAVKPFWKAVLGYEDDGDVALADPQRIGPPFWFQQMDAPRPQRNRIHIDVTVPHDEALARVEAAVAAGGRMVTDEYARSFWVLADVEGNEACICTWQDRGSDG